MDICRELQQQWRGHGNCQRGWILHATSVRSAKRSSYWRPAKQVSYLRLACLLSLTSELFVFYLLPATTKIKIQRDMTLCIFLYFVGAEIAQSVQWRDNCWRWFSFQQRQTVFFSPHRQSLFWGPPIPLSSWYWGLLLLGKSGRSPNWPLTSV